MIINEILRNFAVVMCKKSYKRNKLLTYEKEIFQPYRSQ